MSDVRRSWRTTRNARDANPPRPNVVILNPPTAWRPLKGRSMQTLRVFLGYCCTAAVHGGEAFEKPSGRRDLNPRPLDPQILAPAREPQRMPRSVSVQQSAEVPRSVPGCVPVAVPGCCTASARTRTVRPGAGSQFGRSVARSGPPQRNAGPGHRQWKVREWLTARRCRGWHDRAPPHSTIEKPSVHSGLSNGCRVIWRQSRFVADSEQRPGRLDSGPGHGIAGIDAQKFRIITSLLVAQKASVLVEVLDTLARRACEICQSKKTSVIGRSSHCTVHPEIMSGDMASG